MGDGDKIDELRREVRRLAADNTLAGYDKGWLRGWIIGLVAGAAGMRVLYWLWDMYH